MHPVETYLSGLGAIHSTGGGTKELSFYGPLENLLNDVGGDLKPKVRAVSQLADTGAGLPDFGLYTANQFQNVRDAEPVPGQKPERGVIEVKPWADDSFVTAKANQVTKYWKHYGLVLVTNFRDFVLVGRDESGKPIRLEIYRMAESEREFRQLIAHPRKTANDQGHRVLEFLRRVLLYEAALTDPAELAWFLASYAREARHRVEAAKNLPALDGLKKGLEQALGVEFKGEKGEHFFEATLVQTLFYGVFSSWVLWSRDHSEELDAHFDWHNAAWTLHVPMVASLFSQIATPQKLKPLGVAEVLDWAGAALNRVDRGAFFEKFEEQHAVQYFYEPFLKAYDPELRKELGVWYTPTEVVQYQVERVDHVLRTELSIADGLADDDVVILDPCCGTGAYLVQTLKRIHRTLEEKGGSALTAQKLKRAAMDRVFGFEILPAPFVVAHLQLGLMLRHLGAPLNHEGDQRVGVYLTNALTGWEPPKAPKTKIAEKAGATIEESEGVRESETIAIPSMPELVEEVMAAREVKRDRKILVILGNPPYNGFAGTAMAEEHDLVTAYSTTKRAPKPEGQGRNDLYVRFFRMAERRIVEKSGKGVICYISNYSWLEGLSHPGMRERYLEVFDGIWLDCLNGDKFKTGKVTPWGEPDPSIFSTESNREGIQVGTAIALLVRKESGTQKNGVRCPAPKFRHLWGKDKHDELRRNATGQDMPAYESVEPCLDLGYPLVPLKVEKGYLTWPQLPDIFPVSFPGVQTSRDEFLVDIDRRALQERVNTYFDSSLCDEEIARRYPLIMEEKKRYPAREIRQYLLRRREAIGQIVRFVYRPFDLRWLYWEPETKLLDEKRADYFQNVFEGNIAIAAAQHHRRDFDAPTCVRTLGCRHLYERGANLFPLFLNHLLPVDDLFGGGDESIVPNLAPAAGAYLSRVRLEPIVLFHHVLAITFARTYIDQNMFALRQDWPRIPLPIQSEFLSASADLGKRVAELLDVETPVDGVTHGKIDARLKSLGAVRTTGGRALNPDAGELELNAGWGHVGNRGVCMPGRGKLETRMTRAEGNAPSFGNEILDVYMNDVAYWSNVPPAVWDYTIGGYQVIKKWLSYREKSVLGRSLTMDEAEYVTEMVRRIAALILLQPELDANYEAVKADVWRWPDAK